MDVSSNQLSGNLPDFFHNFPNLTHFSAQSNRFSGGIPSSLSNSPVISFLNLRNNSFNGPIEFDCSMMTNLTSLDLGTNNFSGSIPDDLSSCQNLRAMNLARNRFHGEIPETFKNFRSLSYLSLSNCSFSNLSNTLKILQHCPNLTVLVLTMNFRGEQLSSDDDKLSFRAFKALVIANCSIPSYLGDFDSPFYLDPSNNSLSGVIPKNLTHLPCLSFQEISLEEGSPDFPFFRRPNISNRAVVLQYNQIMSFPPLLDLSNNHFIGSIWPEFGNLKSKGAIAGMAIGIRIGTLFILLLMFLIVFRAPTGQEVDPEKDDETDSNKEEHESKLVVLFQKSNENNTDLSLNDLLKSTNNFKNGLESNLV
ncbi:hypothetical protein Lser_V15G16548 [Lactuca serriola]